MDYEKKYNEALERFKSFKEKYYTKDTNLGDVIFDKTGEMQKDFNGIFPELRESECDVAIAELINYHRRWASMLEDGDTNIHARWVRYLEKQKESLHISESCKDNSDSFTSEDERIRKWLVDYFSSIKATVWIPRDITCEQILDWLEKQKEQKPAWSEEDEKIRNLAIEWAETMYGQFRFVDMGSTDFRKIVAWLKSLRPSWKPSEEQMDALKELIDDANRAGWVTPGATELYEQLKKLM